MGISVAQLHTHLEAARVALAASDYTTAETEALEALAVLGGIPDGEQAGSGVRWRETIDKLLANIARLKREASANAAGGLQVTKVTFAAVSD